MEENEMTNEVHLNIFYHYNEEDAKFVLGMPNECPICAQDIYCPECRHQYELKNNLTTDIFDESDENQTNELLS